MIDTPTKGKIAHSDWGEIVARYEGGETIAQIGRDFGCTGPAIRYIIRKSGRLRDSSTATPSSPLGAAPAPPSEQNKSVPQSSASETGRRSNLRPETAATKADEHGFLGADMRKRVTGDLAAFLVALEQTDATDPESLNALQEATDRLMRAAARVRIELERLFARHAERSGMSRRQPSP